MKLITYLSFKGNCEEAFRFYEKALDGKIVALMRYSEAPPEMPTTPDMKDKVMHARLDVGDQTIMGGDSPPGMGQTPQGFHASIHLGDVKRAERIFKTLCEGGQVTMSWEETFWAKGFGMLVDRFGTPWLVNCDKQM
jgi:PhnB protein